MGPEPRSEAVIARGDQVLLRHPREADAETFIAAVGNSHRLHHPWVSPPDSRRAYADYLRRVREERHCGLLLIQRDDKAIAGVINLSEIVRGAFGNAYMGYYCMAGYEGRGLMLEGMGLAIRHAFEVLTLHRLEANVQPDNHSSLKLVQRLGFAHEGFSPRFLKIDGDWRDHERYALLREEWRGTWCRQPPD